MSVDSEVRHEEIGYGRPPTATRFQKGRSGNPKGRPRNRRRDIPYDALLGQMVTIREDGRERRVTAAEAFILQLTKKGLEGDSASARSSLAAIENARAARTARGGDIPLIRIRFRIFGLCCAVEDLGMGLLVHPTDEERVRLMLKPWIVEAALARLAPGSLSIEEQNTVLESTRTPEKVSWSDWWTAKT
ncbi:MAG TPA: DUF5681 domain-containing protein [Sphingomicrobium sp.]|nr:DUF5681 domain-containing protein [Sphingomicrobium sp.]